jgi:hypothetical protein
VPTDVTVISARRIFDFKFDDLRLSMLTSQTYRTQLQELFRFTSVVVGPPQPTLAQVVNMDPPGLTFAMGEWVDPRDNSLIVVRKITVEPIRIVIDVAAPSDRIEPIYAMLRAWADTIQVPDGGPCIGEPFAVHDLSEVTATLEVPLSAILQPAAVKAIGRARPNEEDGADLQIVPAFSFRFVPEGEDFQPGPSPATFLLEHRAAVPVEEGRWYSHALLDTTRHLEVLGALEAGGRREASRRRKASSG